MHLRRGDWIGLAMVWFDIAAMAVEQADRIVAMSRAQRAERYERARAALVERIRIERHLLRTEHAILEGLRLRDEHEAA